MRLLNILVIARADRGRDLRLQDQVRLDAAGRARRQAARRDPQGAQRHRRAARRMGEAGDAVAHPGPGRAPSQARSRSSRRSSIRSIACRRARRRRRRRAPIRSAPCSAARRRPPAACRRPRRPSGDRMTNSPQQRRNRLAALRAARCSTAATSTATSRPRRGSASPSSLFAGVYCVIGAKLVMFAYMRRGPRRPPHASARTPSPPRGPTSSTATARSSPPTSSRRRCSPSRAS